MQSLRKALFAVTAVVIALFVTEAYPRTSKTRADWDVQARERKANYVYGQSLVSETLDSAARALSLADYAYWLDSTDVYIKAQGKYYKYLSSGSKQDLLDAVRAYSDMFYADPTDYYNGRDAASMASYAGEYGLQIELLRTIDSLYSANTDAAERLANCYVQAYLLGDSTAYGKAMDIFTRLERGVGKDLNLSSQKIRAMLLRKDTTAIEDEIHQILDDMPGDARAYVFAGTNYYYLGNDSLSEAYLKKACEVDSTDGQAYVILAEYYDAKGDSAAYNRELYNSILSPNIDVETKETMLRKYIGNNAKDSTLYPQIRDMLDQVIDENPGEACFHDIYGAFLTMSKDISAAIEQLSYSLDLNPSNDNVRRLLVSHLLAMEDYDKAISLLREGMELSPDNLLYPVIAASTLTDRGKNTEAIELIETISIPEVRNAEAVSDFYASKGDIYQKCDSLDKALEAYDQAIAVNPNNAMAYNNAAYYMAQAGVNLDKALKYARYAVLSNVDEPTYLDTYAWVYFKQKNYPEAKTYIDKALKHIYSMPEIIDTVVLDTMALQDDTLLTDTVYTKPVTEVAFADDHAVMDSDNDTDTVIIDTDDADNTDGKSEAALFNEAMAEGAEITYIGATDVLGHAGDIYFMNGDPDQAVIFWEEALKLDPENELLQRKVKNKTYFYK